MWQNVGVCGRINKAKGFGTHKAKSGKKGGRERSGHDDVDSDGQILM